MQKFSLVASLAVVLLFSAICSESTAELRNKHFKIFKGNHCQPARIHQVGFLSKWWPWDEDEEVLPVPAPEPIPDPQPDPEPLPDSADELPEPEEGGDPVLPTDPAELNAHIASQLGGYVRANHERNGQKLDIYQARGPKQRIVYVVADCSDWMSAIGKAMYLKKKTGATFGGLALVCDRPTPEDEEERIPDSVVPDEEEPAEESDEIPSPDEIPLPDVDPQESDEVFVIYTCGGDDLVHAQEACEEAGLWLVVCHRDTGTVNRVIYNP